LNTRYVIEIGYDGSQYNGWQKQPGQPTIQGEIENALTTIFRQPISIMGSGRTDTGVHAKQQFAHFDLNSFPAFKKEDIIRSLRGLLPHDILVKDIQQMKPEFHARFDALARQYRYQISQEHNVFQDKYSWVVHSPMNKSHLDEAATLLTGELDFGTFSKNNPDVNHTRCIIEYCKWVSSDDNQIIFTIKANRFLHHMVRSLVGTMVEIGKGNLTILEFNDMLNEPNRTKCKFTAPPHALFLDRVYY
jgi:tRNA pseudouridine38-40 synthase